MVDETHRVPKSILWDAFRWIHLPLGKSQRHGRCLPIVYDTLMKRVVTLPSSAELRTAHLVLIHFTALCLQLLSLRLYDHHMPTNHQFSLFLRGLNLCSLGWIKAKNLPVTCLTCFVNCDWPKSEAPRSGAVFYQAEIMLHNLMLTTAALAIRCWGNQCLLTVSYISLKYHHFPPWAHRRSDPSLL